MHFAGQNPDFVCRGEQKSPGFTDDIALSPYSAVIGSLTFNQVNLPATEGDIRYETYPVFNAGVYCQNVIFTSSICRLAGQNGFFRYYFDIGVAI